MKKRIFLSLVAVVAIALGVVGFSAFEAHIINVTATIENALNVPLDPINFGTVFPQEQLDSQVAIAMSASFLAETDADGVEYIIKQKPKCVNTAGEYAQVTENAEGIFICPENFSIMPLLCPYLSKHDADPADQNDYELDAFHGPITAWTDANSTEWAVNGKLAKSEGDENDLWTIDLKVPCFAGQCDQGWAKYVTDINPFADPSAYVQPIENEHKVFGCDLWMEVTGIKRLNAPGVEKYNKSLTLENKDANYNWMIEQDEFKATLLYNDNAATFNFKLTGKAMQPSTSYWLIYYADGWPGNNPGFAIKQFTTDANGEFTVEDSVELDMNLPAPADANFPTGAKIWVVPDSEYDEANKSMISWDATHYLYEYNLITYTNL